MKKLRLLLNAREFKFFLLLMGVMVVHALLQVIGIASILPFMSLVANPDLVHTNEWLNRAYVLGGFENERSMLVATGVAVMVYMAFSNSFFTFVDWIKVKYSASITHRLGVRMTRAYISKPYEYYLTRHSIDFLKRVLHEVNTFSSQVIFNLLEFASKSLVSVVILLLLFAVDVTLATVVFLVLAGMYSVFFLVKRRMVESLGEERISQNRLRFRSLSELMNGLKEIQLYDARTHFYDRFAKSSESLSKVAPRIRLVTVVPRFIIETIAYGGILLITLYLLEYSGSIDEAIPMLSLYALAGYRLVPSLQQSYQSFTNLRHAWPVVDDIIVDYEKASTMLEDFDPRPVARLPFTCHIEFEDVNFTYHGEDASVLNSISFKIARGSTVGFVGRTGSGKTTLIDILTGLLSPTSGRVMVDETPLTDENRGGWQKNVGYVTQELFLLSDTVAHNIAFGVPDEEIDMERVVEAAKLAEAHNFITELLPEGYDTSVGERGVRLSGGQRVRLGIARALYRRPSLIILDEATSALDGITERAIIDRLIQSTDNLTLVLIAHRLSTVKSCDDIFLIEEGVLASAGTFSDLLRNSDVFSEMQELTS
jgi:ABC-type multidrug transport system fused ATPase/permease subunit